MSLCLNFALLSAHTETALPPYDIFEIANCDIVEDPAELPFLFYELCEVVDHCNA